MAPRLLPHNDRVDNDTVTAYLARIGAEAERPSATALRELCVAHIRTVPFENLSIHLGEPVMLTADALADKIIHRRRGGFCYELNGSFAQLLTALGYRVTLLSARVFHGETALGPPHDHLALRVDLAGPWLVDVGFGKHAENPLRIDDRGDQPDPDGVYRVRIADFGDLDVLRNGVPTYRAENRPRLLTDFDAMCWYQQHSPESSFTRNLTCSLPLADGGRVTLSELRLIRTGKDGTRTEEPLDDGAALAAYRDIFGIELDRVPRLRQNIA